MNTTTQPRQIHKSVVTGATSFIGSAVVKELLERDCEVYAIVRPESTSIANLPVHENLHIILNDVSETEQWSKKIKEADTFFHFSWGGPGISGRSDATVQSLSADYAIAALKASKELGVSRFFLSGSQAEYGKTSGLITEETLCVPILEYGKNKLRACNEAIRLSEEMGIEYVHARIFSVYGPNDHPYTLIPECIRHFLKDEKMELSECRNLWNFLHVSDAARAAVMLAECPLESGHTIVNLAGDDTRILREFVEEIHSLAGGKGVCVFGARQVSEKPVDNQPDNRKLKSMINWKEEMTFAKGIRQLIEFEKSRMEN